jgi:hypothetical protein
MHTRHECGSVRLLYVACWGARTSPCLSALPPCTLAKTGTTIFCTKLHIASIATSRLEASAAWWEVVDPVVLNVNTARRPTDLHRRYIPSHFHSSTHPLLF